eukprot:TRINITY_DN9492_c0_g1_i1.p4 TRINITY_DN9492_c0_g1~~TRINITY_DN9492_c0_g1_i1.p4  ORF type:complete len:107 (-),score=3.50 TRINITY_DN9492_c0_g1_i1:132-452(-)
MGLYGHQNVTNELDEAKDEHGRKTAEIGVREISTDNGEQKYGTHKVGNDIGGLWQRIMHVIEDISYEIVPYGRYRHNLHCLQAHDKHRSPHSAMLAGHAGPAFPVM